MGSDEEEEEEEEEGEEKFGASVEIDAGEETESDVEEVWPAV